MKILTFTERLIYKYPVWKLASLIFIVVLFKTGIWYIPNLGASQLIARNPFVYSFQDPNADYLYWSWLGPFLAWFAAATSDLSFFIFHLLFSLGFTVLFVTVAFAKLPDREARTSLVLFSVLPVSATSYFWVGYDSITLFLMMLALATPRVLPVVLFSGIALGMQHFEQAFFGAAGVLFALILSNRNKDEMEYPIKWALALIIGVIIGKIVLFAVFKHFSVSVNPGRIYWMRQHLRPLLYEFFFHFHYIVWSVLGLGWIIAIKYLDDGKRSAPFFISLGAQLVLLSVSADQTRVLAIVSFFLVSVYWLLSHNFLTQISNQLASLIFLIWLVSPWSWVWGGLPKWSVFPYDVAYITHGLFGWFDVPPNPALWPFW